MSTDAIRKKMTALRVEADESASKVEDLTAKVKTLEHANLAKEQEITSLAHKNQLLEQEVEKLETGIREVKEDAAEGSRHGKQNENLTRKLQTLEDEAEETDRKLKELNDNARQSDVKVGDYERKIQALEAARDQWESKYEEMAKKYEDTQKELQNLVSEIGNI